MGWLTTHGMRQGDEKCELGSCLDLSSRTRKHLPPVPPGVLGISRYWGKPSLVFPYLFSLRLPLCLHKSIGTWCCHKIPREIHKVRDQASCGTKMFQAHVIGSRQKPKRDLQASSERDSTVLQKNRGAWYRERGSVLGPRSTVPPCSFLGTRRYPSATHDDKPQLGLDDWKEERRSCLERW